MDMTDIADNLAAGTMDEDAIILNAELLEQTVDAVKAEGYSADETVGWDRLVTEVMTTSKLHTVGHLKQLNYRLAEHYLELDMDALKAIHKQASRKFAAVGDWIFAKSGGEVGRVTEVISTGSPHYADVRKEYLNRYGLDQVSIYESATAMYRVVHADNSEELYYDTETSIEPSQVNVSATQDAVPAKVDPAVLKQAVALWWSLLPSTERQSIFARSGASLKVLDVVNARLARATEADIEEYHPLLATAYKHALANPPVKTAAKPSREELMRGLTHVKQDLAKDPERKNQEIEQFKKELNAPAKEGKREVTRKIELYDFSELPEKGKDRARSHWGENMVEIEPWQEIEEEDLRAKGFTDVELRYSLGYTQGSGASFVSKTMDIPLVIQSLGLDQKFNALTTDAEISASVDDVGGGGHYVHYNTVRARSEIHQYNEGVDQGAIDTLANEFDAALTDKVRDLCREIEKRGYEDIEYQSSDEAIDEMAKANDWAFTVDGKIEYDTEGATDVAAPPPAEPPAGPQEG